MEAAERLRRAQCWSRSGVTPSKARAPSNTLEPSQKAWVRAPTIGWLPSSHSPSRKVKVCDQAGIGSLIPSDEKIGLQSVRRQFSWVRAAVASANRVDARSIERRDL